MADNKVSIEVELKGHLENLKKEASSLPLTQSQKDRADKLTKGAELALKTGDLDSFKTNFNQLAKLFKDAAASTGKLSKEFKVLEDRKSDLTAALNDLNDKRSKLVAKTLKDNKTLTAAEGGKLFAKSENAQKILKKDGTQTTRKEATELQKALSDFVKNSLGGVISKLTNENAQKLGFKDKSSALASNRYFKEEEKEVADINKEIASTDKEITSTEEEINSLTQQLNTLSTNANSAAESVEELYKRLSQIQDVGNKTVVDKKKADREIKKNSEKGVSVQSVGVDQKDAGAGGLGKAFKEFTLYNMIVNALRNAVQEAVQTIKELDKYLTEQAMVTGKTREETYGLLVSYQELATQCGATTKEIAQVSTEYLKQGKTIQESLVLTEAAVKAAKVARVSVGDSVNYLTTALNGFRLEAEEAMRVSDKFAAVAASSATDYDELAIALSKVASQANLAGMSIDYTTALLTKGLETTREAPETMGTALKTIIARMREMGDYGETLEGDTDINNVETQLAYVDIALRNTSGELRSTEEVLDELGKKWDTLNKNQQAAIAKALAGTRQQSRLIAMMEDYERVTELQEISQRSAGATAAQAGVYLEGMEAAMNNIQVAWEKIVMTVTDSDLIIGTFQLISTVLDNLGNFLSNDIALVGVMATVGSIILANLGNRMRELEISKLQQQYALQQNKLENERNIIKQKELIQEKEEAVLNVRDKIDEKEKLITIKKRGIELAKQLKLKAESNGNAAMALKYQQYITDAEKTIVSTESEIQQIKNNELVIAEQELDAANNALGIYTKQSEVLKSQEGFWESMITGATGLITPLIMIWGFYKKIATGINNVILKKKAEQKQTENNTKADITNAGAKSAESAAHIPYAGWIIAAAILAAVGIAAGAAILALSGAFESNKSAENASKQINSLSNEIYKLNEKANAVENITDSFDKLDNKLIKTNNDLKEMNNLLEKAADSLSEEEKEIYNSLTTDTQKRKYLDSVALKAKTEADAKRAEQISLIQSMDATERAKLLSSSSTDASILQAQSAIYALANNKLYDHIDLLKANGELTEENSAAVEELTQSIIENMSAEEAWQHVSSGNGQKIKDLTEAWAELNIEATNASGKLTKTGVASILTSDDYSLKDKVNAYKVALQTVRDLNDTVAFEAFSKQFSEYEFFTHFTEDTLDAFSKIGLTSEKINSLYESWETLQKKGVEISQEVFESRFEDYVQILADTQGDVLAATKAVFSDYLDDSGEALNAFVAAYGDLIQIGILNMGQNMEKTKNSINTFYETASKWNEMSASKQAEFLQDNAELFKAGGEDLLKAFQSGDYNRIQQALEGNEALQKQLEERRKEVAQELMIEEARTGEERNEAYIAQLKEYKKYLDNTEDLFKASLEVRFEQEKTQLDEYKSYLQDQQEALEESLNKRKEAYEKYFDDISKGEEDTEFDEQIATITSNIGKLAASSNASAVNQTKQLEQQLKDLEKERLEQLRERAQEAFIENIDNELSEISDKFDKLLESNQALLAAFRGDLEDPLAFVSQLLGNKIGDGATAMEIESYIKTLESTYGSVLGNGVDWDNINVREENNQLYLTVNGQDIALNTSDEQNLYEVIKKALIEIGAR